MRKGSRRQVLRGCGLAAGFALAGCIGDEGPTTTAQGDDSDTTPATDQTPTSAVSTPTSGPGETATTSQPTDSPAPLQESVAWRFDLNAAIDAPPTVADGLVYVGGWRETYGTPTPGDDSGAPDPSNTLRALSLDDGSEQWRADLGAPVQRAPRVVDDTVYVVRGFDGLHGKHYQVRGLSTDGTERWSHETRQLKFLVVLGADGSGFYVGTHDDALEGEGEQVTALAPDGTVRWQSEIGDVNNGTLDEDAVYVTDYAGNVRAFETDSGDVRWTVEWDELNLREPVVVGDAVVTAGDAAVAFDRANGTELWTYREREPVNLVGGTDRVFLSTADGSVVALNADGSESWSVEIGADPPAIALGEGMLYVIGPDGQLSAYVAATGEQEWTTELDGAAGPVPAGDRVYSLRRERVVALDVTDGSTLGSFDIGSDPVGLVPGEGRDVLATEDGTVYGLSF